MKQRAKLTAGRNWGAFLGGQRSRPETTRGEPLSELAGKDLHDVADRRVRALRAAMKAGDRYRAQQGLNETMYVIRRAKDLPGDEQRRNVMKKVVTWLTDQTPHR